jgi:hypothetical protein
MVEDGGFGEEVGVGAPLGSFDDGVGKCVVHERRESRKNMTSPLF